MITTDEKIEVFKKIINEDIQNTIEQEIEQIRVQNSQKITQYKAQKYEDIDRVKKQYADRLENKTDTIRSKTQKEGQDIILATNKKIYEEFFKELRAKLKEEYLGEKGKKYISTKMQEVKDTIKQDDIIYIYSETFDRDKSIVSSFLPNANIQVSKDIKLGGFEVENKDRTYRMNYSIDFLLDSEYDDILTNLKKEIGINL